MAKSLPEGQSWRKSGLWVSSFHHLVVQMCSRVMRDLEGRKMSSGEFTELAIDRLIETEPNLATLRPVFAEMKLAFEETEKAVEKAQGESGE